MTGSAVSRSEQGRVREKFIAEIEPAARFNLGPVSSPRLPSQRRDAARTHPEHSIRRGRATTAIRVAGDDRRGDEFAVADVTVERPLCHVLDPVTIGVVIECLAWCDVQQEPLTNLVDMRPAIAQLDAPLGELVAPLLQGLCIGGLTRSR